MTGRVKLLFRGHGRTKQWVKQYTFAMPGVTAVCQFSVQHVKEQGQRYRCAVLGGRTHNMLTLGHTFLASFVFFNLYNLFCLQCFQHFANVLT